MGERRRSRTGLPARPGWRICGLAALIVLTVILLTHVTRSRSATADAEEARSSPARVVVASPTAASEAASKKGATSFATPKAVNMCATNKQVQRVLVSISEQHAWMCAGNRQVYSTAVTTGETDNGDQTPRGSWDVQAKQTERWLGGDGYSVHVHFWVPFDGDFGFHDATWQTLAFGSQEYRTAGSHGCVHLPIAAMGWFYNWVQPGAGVTVS